MSDRNNTDEKKARTRARKLYGLMPGTCITMDDESYVLADFQQLPGRSFYHSMNRFSVKKKFSYKKMKKFPKKFLVWQALCTCGKESQSFITRGTMDTEIYLKCLEKHLLPFLKDHEALFWPDLASFHYSNKSLEWYEANNVNIVPREANPANCPELRPIEKYWAIVKRKLRKSQKVGKTTKSFKKMWDKASESVTESVVQKLMSDLKTKVGKFAKQGII